MHPAQAADTNAAVVAAGSILYCLHARTPLLATAGSVKRVHFLTGSNCESYLDVKSTRHTRTGMGGVTTGRSTDLGNLQSFRRIEPTLIP